MATATDGTDASAASIVSRTCGDLSEDDQRLAAVLVSNGQAHLLDGWSVDVDKAERAAFFAAVRRIEATYPGGIAGYVASARKFLADSAMGVNPLKGYTPSVPAGVSMLNADAATVAKYEATAISIFKDCAFVLVAGGLGERLGYNGIKVQLPVTLASNKCYLQTYVEEILAMERVSNEAAGTSEAAGTYRRVPLAIMVSGDTAAKTKALLRLHRNFGMRDDQIVLMKQEKVPALIDNAARFARDGKYGLVTKPHGHGDIHALLHQSGLAAAWAAEGRKFIGFFQDTNAACFRYTPQGLGIAHDHKFEVLSMCIPRKAGEAIGAITKLTHQDGRTITTCVEYNQLAPLLVATGHAGDTNDPTTGFSPYPGNVNQLLFSVPQYAAVLARTKGKIPEFVNPKYTDATKTAFTSPTRLECMMQDHPKVLGPGARVGFATFPLDSFSPVKNSVEGGLAKQAEGLRPQCALSGEMDVYQSNVDRLTALGVTVGAAKPFTATGITVQRPAAITLSPAMLATTASLAAAFPTPASVSITQRSFLVVRGTGAVTIRSLTLDGALVLDVAAGQHLVIDDAVVRNDGWDFALVAGSADAAEESKATAPDAAVDASAVPEFVRIRGYSVVRRQHALYAVDDTGRVDYALVTATQPTTAGAAVGVGAGAGAAAPVKAAAAAAPPALPVVKPAAATPSSSAAPAVPSA